MDRVICGDDHLTAEVLAAFALRVKVISKWRTGIDSIDRQVAARLGIKVCNTTEAITEAVGGSALARVLSFARRTPWMDCAMKAGRWQKIPGQVLHGCSLGVIGAGAIGKGVLRCAWALVMSVLGNDTVTVSRKFGSEVGAEMTPLGGLLVRSDFTGLNCDLSPTSRRLVNAAARRFVRGLGHKQARGAGRRAVCAGASGRIGEALIRGSAKARLGGA